MILKFADSLPDFCLNPERGKCPGSFVELNPKCMLGMKLKTVLTLAGKDGLVGSTSACGSRDLSAKLINSEAK